MHNLHMLRLPSVSERTGEPRSTIYDRIADGCFPPPIKLGPQSSAWPAHEVDAILAARIAGKPAEEIRALVAELIEARKTLPERIAR